MKLHLPYYTQKTKITVQKETVEVKAYQIIVWVSISLRQVPQWDAKIPKIPAILDTGNTHNFAISAEQLQRWAGIHPNSLPERKTMREKGQRVPLRSARLWLHTDAEPYQLYRNRNGTRSFTSRKRKRRKRFPSLTLPAR